MMLNFTEHIKQIIQLSESSLVHVQAENYDSALDDLMRIGINTNEAIQRLDELMHKVKQSEIDTVDLPG